jgi:hypothetical protein
MRNDLTACDGPDATPIGRARKRSRRTMRRGLLTLPLALLLIAPAAAVAVEPTTGYSQTTPPPKTQTTPAPKTETKTETKAEQGTGPSQTSSTAPTKPTKETKPVKASSEPTAATATKAKTLPFTGLDLRWLTIGGLLLIGMSVSIMAVQRGRPASRRSARSKLPS